jgi:hypothetical protein
MVWFLVSQIFSTLISLVQIGRKTESDKDLEILVLRYQLGIADRKLNRTIKPDRIEKLTLAILINRLKSATNRSTLNCEVPLGSSPHEQSFAGTMNWSNASGHTTNITRGADQSSAKTYKTWLPDWPKKIRDGDTAKLRANSSCLASKYHKRRSAISSIVMG